MNMSSLPYQLPIHPPRGDWLGPAEELLAPTRRASGLMLLLGALTLIGGLCIGAAAFMPLDEVLPRSHLDLTVAQARLMFLLTAAFALGVSVALLILGGLMRRGGAASAIVSIVLVGLLTLLIGLQALVQLVQASMQPSDYIIGSAVFSLLIVSVLVLLIIWLAAAIRAAGALQRSRQRQVEQWYSMQNHPGWNGY